MTQETVHFIGIGGIGMSGLARILLQQGKQVSGSDISAGYMIEALQAQGAHISIGHAKENIACAKTVVVSTDIAQDNPELQEAIAKKCSILHRSDLLLQLMKHAKPLAVTGTHGKTTTSALLTYVLHTAGWRPTFAVGGMIPQLETNASHGTGDYFVLEADESDATFLKYPYYGAIVTNVDNDHIAHYGSMEQLTQAFRQFMKQGVHGGPLLFCGDDPLLSAMQPQGISYGFSDKVMLRAHRYRQCGWTCYFDITYKGKLFGDVELALVGRHNALNALAVFGLALELGVPEDAIRQALKTFQGVARRLQYKGEVSHVVAFDDYAHHPAEIKTTLNALRNAVEAKRVIAVFQPHRYSRMQYCMHHFDNAFDAADMAFVTELYTAGEQPIAGVTSDAIVEAIQKVNTTSVFSIPRARVLEKLADVVRPHDVIIFLGAGDITKAAADCIAYLKKKEVKKYVVGVIFGGVSDEHEVSCVSAESIIARLDRSLYDVKEYKIGKDGVFQSHKKERQIASEEVISKDLFCELIQCDLFIPVLHGPFGEDGTIQGFFETIQKPYVGCDVRSCAVSMDKAFIKWIAEANDIATSPFFTCNSQEWTEGEESVLARIQEKLPFPLFVKPTHGGSTFGVSRADNPKSLREAINYAFQFDTHVLVEKEIRGREIEFAVRGNGSIHVAHPGEILTEGRCYSYENKYGASGFQVTVQPHMAQEIVEEGKKLAQKMYYLASCQGLARVDFFLDASNKYWFNEINPFPGFTQNSLYPKMWEQSQLAYQDLLDELIILALERRRREKRHFGALTRG